MTPAGDEDLNFFITERCSSTAKWIQPVPGDRRISRVPSVMSILLMREDHTISASKIKKLRRRVAPSLYAGFIVVKTLQAFDQECLHFQNVENWSWKANIDVNEIVILDNHGNVKTSCYRTQPGR